VLVGDIARIDLNVVFYSGDKGASRKREYLKSYRHSCSSAQGRDGNRERIGMQGVNF
jgi:hypothetical protein